MATLNKDQKLFIVERLACFDAPSEVRAEFKEVFGIELATSQITKYDPTTAGGADLARRLKVVFEETRARFLEKVGDIPIANKSYRLQRLQRMLIKNDRNPKLVKELLEQAAKEVGGAFTNKREHTGPGGQPLGAGLVTVYLPDNQRGR